MGHFSRFLIPGTKIVNVQTSDNQKVLQTTAGVTPTGQVVAVVMNQDDNPHTFTITYNGKYAYGTIPAHAIQTLLWQ